MSSPRVAFFVDHSNFYSGLRQQFGDGKIDYVKLVNRVLGARTLAGFYLYTGIVDVARQPDAAMGQQRFFKALGKLPFQVELFARPLRYYADWPNVPPQEKGVDTKIVQDLIIGAVDDSYDVAVLLSGDQDFLEVVELLHARFPVQLETYYPASRRHLYESAHHCFSKAEVIKKDLYHDIR